MDLSGSDLDDVTRTILAEAGQNASPASMTAVASVIRNRVAAGTYGSSPSEVVRAPNGSPLIKGKSKYDKPSNACSRIETRCLPSTTFRLSTGSICERPIPSKPHSRRSVTEQCAPKDVSRTLFKLGEAAEKSWRRLDGLNQLPKIILGVRFTELKLSNRKLKPLPPDPFRHQDSAIAPSYPARG
jgi:hypothetical protein